MARHSDEHEPATAERFDGAFRCRLCPDHLPREDNDWCPAAQGVVCEDCCRALMMGDERLLEAISRRRGLDLDTPDVISNCTECERLIRLVSEHVPDEGNDARLPMH
jgi:hypothetical protein